MSSPYLAPAPDLFPSALTAALYRTGPNAAQDFVAAFGYFYWATLRREACAVSAKDTIPGLAGSLLQKLGWLLEAPAATFVTFVDRTTEVLVPYPLGDAPATLMDNQPHSGGEGGGTGQTPASGGRQTSDACNKFTVGGATRAPVMDPAMQPVAWAALHQGLPQCATMSDGTTCVAIPCYAYGTLDRPDLAAAVEPWLLVATEAFGRAIGIAKDPPPEPSLPSVLGVMLVQRPAGAEALSALAWQRAFYCAAYGAQVIAALAMEDKLPPLMIRPTAPRPARAPISWQVAIPHHFTRTTAAGQLAHLGRTALPADWQRFLLRAYTQLGFGHPAKLHPKHLYERLSRYQNAGALLAMTEMTKASATSLSMTALTEEWLGTLRNVMSGVTQVIPDAPTVVFAASKGDGHFTIQHTLDATLTPEQEAAFAMVALWAAVQGEAIHDVAARSARGTWVGVGDSDTWGAGGADPGASGADPPTDGRPLFQHLRTVAPTTAPLVAIPVYNWRVVTGAVKEWPDLHGVFIGIRHADAQLPSAAMWCAWVLAAQYLLSPLAAAVEAKKAPYRPVDVERSMDTASRKPFDPRSAREQASDDFWLETERLRLR
ncbi:MAG: hypothetical protein HY543_04370 [Deltaproteobacteria bacterium]|nr:hypothetical protein [Deltaproteobacteria bacterium]